MLELHAIRMFTSEEFFSINLYRITSLTLDAFALALFTKSVSREIEHRAGTKKCRFLGPQPGHGHMHVKPEPSKLTREHYTCMYGMCV